MEKVSQIVKVDVLVLCTRMELLTANIRKTIIEKDYLEADKYASALLKQSSTISAKINQLIDQQAGGELKEVK